MNILPNIKIIDLALYLEKQKILILSDFHIGYEEYLNNQGILIPRFQFKEILQRLENIFKNNYCQTIIIKQLDELIDEFGINQVNKWRNLSNLNIIYLFYILNIIFYCF